MSAVRIRKAEAPDYPGVRACMEEVFKETAGQKSSYFSQQYWEWQYLLGDAGSIVVMAEDGHDICGYYHVPLCRMRYHGHTVTAAMIQDVGTRKAYRGRGVFRGMGASALGLIRERGIDIIYTFPNGLSLPSFVRNHAYEVIARVPIYIAPLRTGALLAGPARLGMAGDILGSVLDRVCRTFATGSMPLEKGEEVKAINSLDVTIEPATRDFSDRTTISLGRSFSYLNWRFSTKPWCEYTVWGLYSRNELRAYAVTRQAHLFSTSCLLLMDFGCRDGEDKALMRLIASRQSEERRAGLGLFVTVGIHPFLKMIRKLGFIRVPEQFNPRPFNLLVKDLAPHRRNDLFQESSWTITLADWDVF